MVFNVYGNEDKEQWMVRDHFHRLDGPAIRERIGKNFWFLSGVFLNNMHENKEIVALYNELGDWELFPCHL